MIGSEQRILGIATIPIPIRAVAARLGGGDKGKTMKILKNSIV